MDREPSGGQLQAAAGDGYGGLAACGDRQRAEGAQGNAEAFACESAGFRDGAEVRAPATWLPFLSAGLC